MSRRGWTLAGILGIAVIGGVAWLVSRKSAPAAARGRSPSTRVEGLVEPRDESVAERRSAQASPSANPQPSNATERDITGIVRDDETGEGIAEASVRREGSNDSASTDRFGRFRLRGTATGTAAIVAEHADFETARVEVEASAPPADLELRLAPALTLSGRVVDAARGAGIEGASIFFFRTATGASAHARSEADGAYRMRGLPAKPPPEGSDLRVETRGWDLDREALALAMRDRAPESRGLSIDLPMRSRTSLEGRVVEPDGSPAAGASVFPWLTPEGHWITSPVGRTARRVHGYDTLADCLATADETGRFHLDEVPAGVPLTIVAHLPALGDARETGLWMQPGERRAGLELILEPGSAIEGDVRSDADLPIAGAALTASRVESATREVLVGEVATDSSGAFRIAGLGLGEWSVAATAKGFSLAERTRVVLRAGGTARITLRLSSADNAISGRVTDSQRQPISSAEVVVMPENDSSGDSFVPVSVQTDAGGRYRAGGLESVKTFTVQVNGPSNGPRFAMATRKAVKFGSDDVDFVLQRSATLRGTIRGLDPMPPWISVEARISDPSDESRALFARSGRCTGSTFEVPDLMEGNYQLTARLLDKRWARRDGVRVAEGETVEGVDLVFGAGKLVRGHVEDATAHVIAGAAVELAPLDADGAPIEGAIRRAATGMDGQFSFSDVSDGPYAVRASDASHAPSILSRLSVPRRDDAAEIVLRLTDGGFIIGTVLDVDGAQPVAGAHVGALLEGENFPLVATTDSEGRFRIRVPAGRYVVVAMRGDFEARESARCEVRDGTDTTLTLTVRRGT